MLTFGAFKNELRSVLWPTGEAPNLIAAHNKSIVDAMCDIQKWVLCSRYDNTNVVEHCATYYNCGLTVIDLPSGVVRRVSTIDRLDTDGNPSIDGVDDWCGEIFYTQVDVCHVRSYLNRSNACGSCLPFSAFALSAGSCGGKNSALVPTATDEGVSSDLPLLPLGFHYPQESTDLTRALSGVYAIEQGKLWVAPWIQTTESLVVRWEGIKTSWADSDPFPDDPLVKRAVKAWVAREHKKDWDEDYNGAKVAGAEYSAALADLIHGCRERTRVRGCDPMLAQGHSNLTAALFYNEEQSYTATCPPPNQGSSVTQTVAAGLVASRVSVEDANNQALSSAKSAAEAALSCQGLGSVYYNAKLVVTYDCSDFSDGFHPTPVTEGGSVTITIEAGEYESTISQAQADASALAASQANAQTLLTCQFYNKAVSFTAACPSPNESETYTASVAAKAHQSPVSEKDADATAQSAAENAANALLVSCPAPPVLYWNDAINQTTVSNNTILIPCGAAVRIKYISVCPEKVLLNTSKQAANQQAQTLIDSQISQLNARLPIEIPQYFPSALLGAGYATLDPNFSGSDVPTAMTGPCVPNGGPFTKVDGANMWEYTSYVIVRLDELSCPAGTTCEL